MPNKYLQNYDLSLPKLKHVWLQISKYFMHINECKLKWNYYKLKPITYPLGFPCPQGIPISI